MGKDGCPWLKDGKNCLDPLDGPPCEIAEFCTTRRDWVRRLERLGTDGCPWETSAGMCPFKSFDRNTPTPCDVADGQECPARERRRGAYCMFDKDRRCDEGCVAAHEGEKGCGLKNILGDIAESLTMLIHHVRDLGG